MVVGRDASRVFPLFREYFVMQQTVLIRIHGIRGIHIMLFILKHNSVIDVRSGGAGAGYAMLAAVLAADCMVGSASIAHYIIILFIYSYNYHSHGRIVQNIVSSPTQKVY